MIKTFKSKYVESLFIGDYSDRKLEKILPRVIYKKTTDKLNKLHIAGSYAYLYSDGLEDLTGNLKGFKSIRINRQYRIVFKMDENFNCYEVDVTNHYE